MYWDDVTRRFRRGHGGNAPELLSGAGGHVAVPQAPRPRRRVPLPRSWLAWASLALGAVIATAYIIWPGEVAQLLGL